MKNYGDDPDETEGRKLYRARAEALATAQVSYARRRVKLQTAPKKRRAFSTPPSKKKEE